MNEWTYKYPAPPQEYDRGFFDWLRKMEEALSIRFVDWVDMDYGCKININLWDTIPPNDVAVYYEYCNPWGNNTVDVQHWKNDNNELFEKHGQPLWPIYISNNNIAVARREGDDTSRIIHLNSDNNVILIANGIRNYLIAVVVAEIISENESASIPLSIFFSKPEVVRFARQQ
jgi:hypothetical protein